MKDLAIFGAGGFGREIACIIKQINAIEPKWNLIGFFDDNESLLGSSNEYGVVLGNTEVLNSWNKPLSIVIAIGNPNILRNVSEKINNQLIDFPNIIAPNACIMDYDNIKMGKGNVICPNCLISCNVELGNFNLINVMSQLGHDTKMMNYNVVMPSVNISGGVVVGNCNLFGVKSFIIQYKTIENNVLITPGSIMLRNGKDNTTYMGNPAKKIEL
ncbi:MAG: acetyltransferase [Prevotella sp.]|nr:acetyltransferase [Prevotella sp.]